MITEEQLINAVKIASKTEQKFASFTGLKKKRIKDIIATEKVFENYYGFVNLIIRALKK